MITHAIVDMGADGAIVCTDDAIAKDNTELVFDRDCHDIQRGYHLARARWCGSPGVARHSPSVVLMLGTRQSGQSRYVPSSSNANSRAFHISLFLMIACANR
jgi:hypothetical protein